MQTTGSENSDVIPKHPQILTSEGEVAKTRQEEEGSSLMRYRARIVQVYTLERQEEPWRSGSVSTRQQ